MSRDGKQNRATRGLRSRLVHQSIRHRLRQCRKGVPKFGCHCSTGAAGPADSLVGETVVKVQEHIGQGKEYDSDGNDGEARMTVFESAAFLGLLLLLLLWRVPRLIFIRC